MKLFSCHACRQMLFFESVRCTRCGLMLAYLPDRGIVSAVKPDTTPLVRALAPGGDAALYRLCRNYTDLGACNWAVPASEPDEYCRACRLNHIIPNLGDPAARAAWRRLEIAKRRLIYTLQGLGLPVETKDENPAGGLAFAFLQEENSAEAGTVVTGHSDGLVTINIAEADDPFREKMRVRLGEAYRTVLGHFRHEVGHYYWERLIRDSPRLSGFRGQFGDERAGYDAAQARHYEQGPPSDWPGRFVSAYASMHPWEDWAETWAHYLHMVDTLETARAHDLSLRSAPADTGSFDDLINDWIPLTIALNNLNRSMGMNDCYPFVLPETAKDKLRFVHEVAGTRI